MKALYFFETYCKYTPVDTKEHLTRFEYFLHFFFKIAGISNPVSLILTVDIVFVSWSVYRH